MNGWTEPWRGLLRALPYPPGMVPPGRGQPVTTPGTVFPHRGAALEPTPRTLLLPLLHPLGLPGGKAGVQCAGRAICTTHELQLLFARRSGGWRVQKLLLLFPTGINDIN